MPRGKRYLLEYGDDVGITPSRLKRLSKAKQREYLLTWFRMHYEDPAQETPYNSQEGGYQYVWGGPYDAREELEGEFGSLVSESVIEDAVEDIESDGLTDWAPGRYHDDHMRAAQEHGEEQRDDTSKNADNLSQAIKELESGLAPTYGDAVEKEYRHILSSDIEKILQMLPPRSLAGIGHNKPPLDDESTAQDAIEEIREAATTIQQELAKPAPDALVAARSTINLQSAEQWIWKKFDAAADSFSKKIGEHLATAIVAGSSVGVAVGWYNIGALIRSTVDHASHWLSHILSAL